MKRLMSIFCLIGVLLLAGCDKAASVENSSGEAESQKPATVSDLLNQWIGFEDETFFSKEYAYGTLIADIKKQDAETDQFDFNGSDPDAEAFDLWKSRNAYYRRTDTLQDGTALHIEVFYYGNAVDNPDLGAVKYSFIPDSEEQLDMLCKEVKAWAIATFPEQLQLDGKTSVYDIDMSKTNAVSTGTTKPDGSISTSYASFGRERYDNRNIDQVFITVSSLPGEEAPK